MISKNGENTDKKQSWEWLEDDLITLKKAQAQESLYLEFKRSASLSKDSKKKDELSKDISSFANSDGGEIVYGVSETGDAPSRFEDFDEGIDISDFPPEWLENVINSRIQPRINGIRVNPIELKTVNPGKFVYAIHIPSSMNAPHQASDKKYYKRFNYHSIPMEDYEIRDVRNRQQNPELKIECEVLTSQFAFLSNLYSSLMGVGLKKSAPVLVSSFNLRIWVINSGMVVARYPHVILTFQNLVIKKANNLQRIDDIRGNIPSLQWTSSTNILYPHSSMKIADLVLGVKDLNAHCVVNTEICAEKFLTTEHKYTFLSAELFVANLYENSGKKIRVTLDTIEKMLMQTDSISK
jgi:hypothetical protein